MDLDPRGVLTQRTQLVPRPPRPPVPGSPRLAEGVTIPPEPKVSSCQSDPPGWFVCCTLWPRGSWSYKSLFSGLQIYWRRDRNGCQRLLRPGKEEGIQHAQSKPLLRVCFSQTHKVTPTRPFRSWSTTAAPAQGAQAAPGRKQPRSATSCRGIDFRRMLMDRNSKGWL